MISGSLLFFLCLQFLGFSLYIVRSGPEHLNSLNDEVRCPCKLEAGFLTSAQLSRESSEVIGPG